MARSGKFGGFPSPEFVSRFRTQALLFDGGPELLERLERLPSGELVLIFVQRYCGSRVESPTRAALRAHTSSLDQVDNSAG
jgi:hypothetical protein